MKKKISNVLWFYFERNDLDDLKIEKKNKILIKYLDKEFKQNLYLQQYQIDKKLRFFLQSLNNKNPIKKKNNAFQKIIRLQIIRDKLALDRGLNFKIDPIFYRVISLANSLVNEKEGKLFFIYLPDKERYSNNLPVEKNLYKKKEVIKLISQLNIEIIDIDEEFFLKQEDPLNFFADRIYGHYSAEGYNRISKTILEKINKNNYN